MLPHRLVAGFLDFCSRCARVMKVEVIAAVTIARNATPSSITTAPTILPAVSLGVTSPYPTVVTVCRDHHMPSQMLEYSRWSIALIAIPPTTTTMTVAVTIRLAALRIEIGSCRNRFIRRSIVRGRFCPAMSRPRVRMPGKAPADAPTRGPPPFLSLTPPPASGLTSQLHFDLLASVKLLTELTTLAASPAIPAIWLAEGLAGRALTALWSASTDVLMALV